jgi:hypothetical protein
MHALHPARPQRHLHAWAETHHITSHTLEVRLNIADQGTALQRGQGAGSQVFSVLHMPLYAQQIQGGALLRDLQYLRGPATVLHALSTGSATI